MRGIGARSVIDSIGFVKVDYEVRVTRPWPSLGPAIGSWRRRLVARPPGPSEASSATGVHPALGWRPSECLQKVGLEQPER